MKIQVITHYPKSDTEFHGDHYGIDVCVEGKPAVYFGDEYHEHGHARVLGFFEALDLFGIEYERVDSKVADYED